MNVSPEVKSIPFSITKVEVDKFKVNFPVQYPALIDCIKEGKFRIVDEPSKVKMS